MKKTISIIAILVLCITMATVFNACDFQTEDDTNTESNIHNGSLQEWISYKNGVSFNLDLVQSKTEIVQTYRTLTATGKFVMCAVKVKNESNNTFISSASDVWLRYGTTKIGQSDYVYNGNDGWHNISLSATLEKTYVCIFDVGADIPLDELELVINNGYIFDSESVIIKITA